MRQIEHKIEADIRWLVEDEHLHIAISETDEDGAEFNFGVGCFIDRVPGCVALVVCGPRGSSACTLLPPEAARQLGEAMIKFSEPLEVET